MSIQELLRPRFKCIGTESNHYPGSPFFPGDIIEKSGLTYRNEKRHSINDDIPGMYPHLFVPLEWWQERDFDLAGMYIRFGNLDAAHSYYKITSRLASTDYWNMEGSATLYGGHIIEHCLPLNRSFPATEKEYLDFVNKPKK